MSDLHPAPAAAEKEWRGMEGPQLADCRLHFAKLKLPGNDQFFG